MQRLEWRPILVGGIFNTVNPSVYEFREKGVPAKAKYAAKDLQDWARFYGLVIKSPTVFPVNSIKALRGALVALDHPEKFLRYSSRVFESYWGEDKDISKDDVLRGIVEEVGLDATEYFDKINRQEYKDRDPCQHRRGHGSRRLWYSNDFRQRFNVFWKRPDCIGRGRAATGGEITGVEC